ncbi:MAG: 30S ribosomal protein S5 [Candidatus Niyogibacteria bacterium CG10_big_fil_rev_8_21_14_0_10_42_19]|uniref:Small ribosomal subunit protein uS5 n=1 Tax=Candidatus Niyogibacteria bacterium CG10_big_fil_rev_8_21_14_0_10_42_19 TaxID=1974725 RepID=A0A2H0TFC7_9BACT|nr:MAG: 30S ribosomal protein S5 [Candidatus Niyogibacteria bacterium CG10_big_fil_rev_8_21_14_0_10_42_19]
MQRRQRNFKEKSEFDHKLIDLRRVARVEAGGRRFSFRATVVAGDKKGRVGVGVAKGTDTALSIEKAFREARKNAITVPITENGSIPHDVEAKYSSAKVLIRRAPTGTGLVAGSAVRTILDLCGVQNTTAKILSHTKNKINNARAAIEALKKLKK